MCPWEARVIARPKPGKKTRHGSGGAPKIVVAVKPQTSNAKGTIKATYGTY